MAEIKLNINQRELEVLRCALANFRQHCSEHYNLDDNAKIAYQDMSDDALRILCFLPEDLKNNG